VGTAIAVLLALPVLTVAAGLLAPTDGTWARLVAVTLPQYVLNTAALLLGTGLGALVIGVGTAWLVVAYRFPGSGLCTWLLLLPLSVPAYLLAYVYADLLQFTGPLQTALRGWFGWERGDYWFPEIRSLGGAVGVMTFAVYPYVYMLARTAFLEQSASVLEASRTLGVGPWPTFIRVAVPLARPGIVAGLTLALMEVLADFGAVKHFEVPTFTTGIYLTWFGLGSPMGAAKLASGLLMFVALILAAERALRGGRRFHQTAMRAPQTTDAPLGGARGLAALVCCLVPPAVGFLVPGAVLLRMALVAGDPVLGSRFVALAGRSLGLAALAALVSVAAATVLAYGVRLAAGPAVRAAARLATLGYALPGSLIAVGVMLPAAGFDNAVDAWARATIGRPTGLLVSGTVVVLIFAYLVRFLAISFNTVDAALSRIRPGMDEAARTLGHGARSTLLRVHAPLMSGSLLAAGLLVFVDTLKELPATLILRPFNFDTLAIRVYQLASDERLAQASTAALAIVGTGLLPVFMMSWAVARARDRDRPGALSGHKANWPRGAL
jgi:iron(III) transport system permease protein